jgi:geranylgeranyl diphosphate synthase type I
MREQTSLVATVQERCLGEIETCFTRFFERARKDGFSYNAEMAQYQLSTGGKRLRALIPCLIYAACGKNPSDAVALGCAVEMIHNATLVHDDLQDGDTVRRGKPTVWKKYSEAQSINCGDAMFQFGHQLLLELPLEPAVLQKLGLDFLRGITRVIEGQAQEFLLKEETVPTVKRYLQIVEGKTAALLATAFTLAAESLKKPADLCREIERAGFDLGVLFQMQDDLLDLYGEKGRDRRATDIAEGKISILVAQFFEDAAQPDRDRMLTILRKPREQTSDTDIDEALALFERYRTREAVLGRIEELRGRVQALSFRTEEPALQALFTELAELFLDPIKHLLRATG